MTSADMLYRREISCLLYKVVIAHCADLEKLLQVAVHLSRGWSTLDPDYRVLTGPDCIKRLSLPISIILIFNVMKGRKRRQDSGYWISLRSRCITQRRSAKNRESSREWMPWIYQLVEHHHHLSQCSTMVGIWIHSSISYLHTSSSFFHILPSHF